MMYQGLLGAFPFTVSESEVCTFRDLRQSRELNVEIREEYLADGR